MDTAASASAENDVERLGPVSTATATGNAESEPPTMVPSSDNSHYATPVDELDAPPIVAQPTFAYQAPTDTTPGSSVLDEKAQSAYASARASMSGSDGPREPAAPVSALLNLPPPPPLDLIVNNLTIGVPKPSRIGA